jgi:hypothetical protein
MAVPAARDIDWGLTPPVDQSAMSAREVAERNRFLDLVFSGKAAIPAGLTTGWSLLHTRKVMQDPMIAEILTAIESIKDDTMESAVYGMGLAGNFQAAQWWLLNRRGAVWKDTKRVVVDSTERISIEVVHSVKRGALELLREHGVAALQPGGALDQVIDVDSTEVVHVDHDT